MRNNGNISELYEQVKENSLNRAIKNIVEKLGKNADMGDYIDDFAKSDAPQFKGASKEKRREMAIAAFLDKKDKKEGFASDAQRRAAFAQGYKAKGKKGKKEEVKEKLMNAYRQQWKELGEKRDPADIDVKATSKDQEMADQNVVMQLRKAGNLGGTKEVKFGDGKKVKVKPQIAQRVMSKMMTLRTTQEKEKFQQQIGKSYRDLLNALK